MNSADQTGVPLPELCAGLPFDAHLLRHRVADLEWDFFVELLERLEARAGTEKILALCATVPDISPTGRSLFRHFVSARLLMRFVCSVVGPSMYPMYESSWEETEQPDGGVVGHLRIRLRPGFRGCRLIFRIHAAANAAVPCFIGHPALPVRAETDERGGDYWFTL
ncbi:MAG: hypothetical protein AB1938_08195 [Myxococcota bacterium]